MFGKLRARRAQQAADVGVCWCISPQLALIDHRANSLLAPLAEQQLRLWQSAIVRVKDTDWTANTGGGGGGGGEGGGPVVQKRPPGYIW